MVGNKHKNGIICTFPGCQKTMRTQKFKLHFTKAHLKQGEVYSVEHRRRFEVAREDGASRQSSGGGSGGGGATAATGRPALSSIAPAPIPGHVEAARLGGKSETAASGAVLPAANGVDVSAPRLESVAAPVDVAVAAKAHEEVQMPQSQLYHQTHTQVAAPSVVSAAMDATASQQLPVSAPRSGMLPMPSSISMSTATTTAALESNVHTGDSGNPVGSKRSASSMEDSAGVEALDPSSALLVEFVGLMDRRFQELVGKMSEMIEVQKHLIDALHGRHPAMFSSSEQAAGMPLVSAGEGVLKKRKQDSDLRDSMDEGGGVEGGHEHDEHEHDHAPDEGNSFML